MRLSRIPDLIRFVKRSAPSGTSSFSSRASSHREAHALAGLAATARCGSSSLADDQEVTIERCHVDAEDLMRAGRFEEAKKRLEHGYRRDGFDRFLFNVCRCATGEKAAARLDLFSWMNEGSIPAEARVLLALLLEEDGDELEALQAARIGHEDQQTAEVGLCDFLQALMHQERGRIPEAQEIARRMCADRHISEQGELVELLEARMARLGLCEQSVPGVEPARRETISEEEVIEFESALPAIVEGLQLSGDAIRAARLAHAIAPVLSQLNDRQAGYEMMVQLGYTARAFAHARSWALAGLREFPRSARLLLAAMGSTTSRVDPVDLPEVETISAPPRSKKDQAPVRSGTLRFPAGKAVVKTAVNRDRVTAPNAGEQSA